MKLTLAVEAVTLLTSLALLAPVAVVPAAAAKANLKATQKPHIIFTLVDDLGFHRGP